VIVPFDQDFRDTPGVPGVASDRQTARSTAKTQKIYFEKQVRGPSFAVELTN